MFSSIAPRRDIRIYLLNPSFPVPFTTNTNPFLVQYSLLKMIQSYLFSLSNQKINKSYSHFTIIAN